MYDRILTIKDRENLRIMVAYGAGEAATKLAQPILVLLHDGLWTSKYRLESMDELAYSAMNALGCMVVNVAYTCQTTSNDRACCTETMADLETMLDWLNELPNIGQRAVCIIGHGSGGALALHMNNMVVLREGQVNWKLHISSTVILAGTCDLEFEIREGPEGRQVAIRTWLGPDCENDGWREHFSPVHQRMFTGDILFVHGGNNKAVSLNHTIAMMKHLDQLDTASYELVITSDDHDGTLRPTGDSWHQVVDRIKQAWMQSMMN